MNNSNSTPSQLDQFPSERLSPEAEADLAAQIKQGSEAAVTVLVLANMREAILYTGKCDDRLDEGTRISLCYREMCMSAKRFRPGGIRFFAFAKAGLRGCMKRHWESLRVVRNGDAAVSLEALDAAPSSGRHHRTRSISPSPDDDKEHSDREVVTGEVTQPATDQILARDEWAVIRKRYDKSLSEQQWMILSLIYLSGFNLPQVGKLLNLSKARIHAVHWKAIKKLRVLLSRNPQLLYGEDSCD
jgi:RNA polymerase sigma factor (sigma-70 family)